MAQDACDPIRQAVASLQQAIEKVQKEILSVGSHDVATGPLQRELELLRQQSAEVTC
jgi:hypothetical protein